jgi:hypothetical protein
MRVVRTVSLVVAGAALLCATVAALWDGASVVQAQVGPGRGNQGGPASRNLKALIENAVRIDGSTLQQTWRVVSELPVPDRGESAELGMPWASTVLDAWTNIMPGTLGEAYAFAGGPVNLNLLFKISPAGAFVCADYVLVPCGTSVIPPVPPGAIFIDDVVFGPAPPGAVIIGAITLPAGFVPAGMDWDWLSVVDFGAAANPPGVCAIELGPAMIFKLGTPMAVDLDEVGAEVFELFAPGPPTVDVYQPLTPFLIPPKVPFAKPGECGETRPWCFCP